MSGGFESFFSFHTNSYLSSFLSDDRTPSIIPLYLFPFRSPSTTCGLDLARVLLISSLHCALGPCAFHSFRRPLANTAFCFFSPFTLPLQLLDRACVVRSLRWMDGWMAGHWPGFLLLTCAFPYLTLIFTSVLPYLSRPWKMRLEKFDVCAMLCCAECAWNGRGRVTCYLP